MAQPGFAVFVGGHKSLRSRLTPLIAMLVSLGCTPEMPPPPPPPPPPQVFLTIAEPNVIGNSVDGQVAVSGCNKVMGVEIRQNGMFLTTVPFANSPTKFSLPVALFKDLWGQLGFAASLTLTAKVVCDDARNNLSQPVGVTLFPVEKNAAIPMPSTFVAQGGIGGNPVEFVGCAKVNIDNYIGNALVRMSASTGDILAYNKNVPCNAGAQISEKATQLSPATRWILDTVSQTAYLIDSVKLDQLKVIGDINGPFKMKRMGVGKGGSALFWRDNVQMGQLVYARPVTSTLNDWMQNFPEKMNADPVIDEAGGVIWTSSWQYNIGNFVGNTVVLKYSILNGMLLNGSPNPPVIKRQTFGLINKPFDPQGSFNADGTLLYLPFLSEANGIVKSTVLACPTSLTGCENATLDINRTFDGVIQLVIPFAGGVAALGPYQAWFLTNKGAIRNLGEQPLRPSGSLIFNGAQPGKGSDFYLFAAPRDTAGDPSPYPTELIATDRPENGELWRVQYGTGESDLTSFLFALDDNGQPWIRMGTNQVKPLTNAQYRMSRGPTILP
jgi:hypothetical protein